MFLNYKIQGDGEPVLLIHGLFGSLDNLGALANQLAKNHKVYQIDLPNHGLSPHLAHVDYLFQSEAVKEFIVQQGLSAVDVIGHSMGGKVAMMLAINHPDVVTSLVVMDIAPVNYPIRRHDTIFAALNACENAKISSRNAADIKLAEYIDTLGVRQFLLKSFAKGGDGYLQWRFNVTVLEQNYAAIMAWPATGDFQGKTLFIKGADSDYISPQYRPQITQQFPHAKLHIVANAGHWLHAEKPDTVARVISRFLARASR